jgi:copper ion binding protein
MKTVINVEGMSCAHCVNAVNRALREVEGVVAVDVDLQSKTATVEHSDTTTFDNMKTAIEEAGYEVV